MKEVDELFVGMPVEHQCTAVGMERHFEHARFRPCQPSIGKDVAVVFKTSHELLLIVRGHEQGKARLYTPNVANARSTPIEMPSAASYEFNASLSSTRDGLSVIPGRNEVSAEPRGAR